MVEEGLFVDCPDQESFLAALKMYQIREILQKGNTFYGIKGNTVIRYTRKEKREPQLHIAT